MLKAKNKMQERHIGEWIPWGNLFEIMAQKGNRPLLRFWVNEKQEATHVQQLDQYRR